MVARTRIEPDVLVVEFTRDGEEPVRELVVGNGERVLLYAVVMLVRRRELRLHNRLTIREPEEGVDIPA